VRTIGQPPGVNDRRLAAVAVTVVADRVPSIVKCTTVLARPVPLSDHWRDVINGRRPGVERQILGQRDRWCSAL